MSSLPAGPAAPTVLAALLRADAGRPIVTYYGHEDDGTVLERTELSTTTYANWVAKVAGLLSDEFDLERGDTVHVNLGTAHWLTPVFWGAAWSAGLRIALDVAEADASRTVVLAGPRTLPVWAERAGAYRGVLASALTPFARPFPDGVPDGVLDLGVEVWSQPDAFVALDPPEGHDVAFTAGDAQVSQSELSAGARARLGERRLLEDLDGSLSAARAGAALLLGGGALVLVDGAAPHADWWQARRAVIAADERLS